MTMMHERIEARAENILPPIPTDQGSTVALTGMVRNPSLDFCSLTRFRTNNCPLPEFWVDECRIAEEGLPPNPDITTKTVWGETAFLPFRFFDAQESPCVDPLIDLSTLSGEIVTEATAWAVTKEFDHAPSTGNPSLRTTATDLSAGSAVSPKVGFSKLMEAMALRGIGRMTIHIPFHALPLLDDVVIERGSSLRTRLGNILVNTGLGFTGASPGGVVTAGQTYIYATRGTVEYNVGELDRYGGGTLTHERTNTAVAGTFRDGAIRFDPECVFGVNICLNEVSCCD